MKAALLLACAAFLLVVPWGEWVIRELLRRGIGKHIRVDGPASHQAKSGTATMGGVYILAGIAVFPLGLSLAGLTEALVPFIAMLSFGLLGTFDDLQGLKDAQGVGWLARSKFSWQWILSAALALMAFVAAPSHLLVLPGSSRVINVGWWFVPVTALAIVGASNAVNLTDGLDGLAGGMSAIAYGAYGVIAGVAGQRGLSLFCLAMVGVLLAFLWYNVHPARIFMGDTGSQALGAGLAVVAMMSGHWLLLPVIGAVFGIEALSVMLQVGYFKATRLKYGVGRRVFRMAPLHHHFELVGWPEVQITQRFWIAAGIAALVGVALGIG
jgi:phospho-N-acetylmuramoyl-pentapeptide-transferase